MCIPFVHCDSEPNVVLEVNVKQLERKVLSVKIGTTLFMFLKQIELHDNKILLIEVSYFGMLI